MELAVIVASFELHQLLALWRLVDGQFPSRGALEDS